MIKIVDLFCGAGGLGYGFYNDPKFQIVFANDIDKNMVATYKANHRAVQTVCSNISELTLDTIQGGNIDMVIGGPPCQTFSTIGKRNPMDTRNFLFREYIRILQQVKPKVFIFENVRGILSMYKGNLIKEMIQSFNTLGYKVHMQVLDAVQFGVPQYRERVFIVGNNMGKKCIFPTPTHTERTFVTFADAVSDLPSIGVNDTSTQYAHAPLTAYQKFVRKTNNGILTEHTSPNNGAHLIRIMQALPDGGTPRDIPEHIRPKSGYINTYCKLWWDRPVPTITRNFSTPSSSRCIHPKDSRALTTREGARLQSFPDDYVFKGHKGSKNLQIGNAVPPLLSLALTECVTMSFFT